MESNSQGEIITRLELANGNLRSLVATTQERVTFLEERLVFNSSVFNQMLAEVRDALDLAIIALRNRDQSEYEMRVLAVLRTAHAKLKAASGEG